MRGAAAIVAFFFPIVFAKEVPRLVAYPGAFCCTEALKDDFLAKVTDGTTGWWPEPCSWQQGLFGFEQKPFTRAGEPEFLKKTFRKACLGWFGLVGHGSRLTSQTPINGSDFSARIARELLPFFPYGDMAWVQWAAVFLQHELCKDWNKEDVIIAQGRKMCTGREPSNCNCFAVIRENLELIFSGLPARAAPPAEYVGRLLHILGNTRLSPKESPLQEELGVHARREVWGRFLLRSNKSDPAPGAADEQRAWATAMADQAFRVADQLQREPSAEALLDLAGQARAQVKTPDGKNKNINFGGRRTGGLVRSIVTPLSGNTIYPGLWRRTLLNRIERKRRPFFTPHDEEADRSYACGATVTWVVLPWKDCDAVIRPLGATIGGHDDRTAGVEQIGDTCRVVLNRAVAVSPLDGYILGEECQVWYGSSQLIFGLPNSHRVLPIMYHSAPLAIDIMQRTILQQELKRYYQLRTELLSYQACRDPEVAPLQFVVAHPVWRELLRCIAALYWYFLNTMPYERGTSTTGILFHHSLIMAVFPDKRQQARALLLCVPLFRNEAYPDWEALGNPLEEFVDEVYDTLFERTISPRCLHMKLFDKTNVQW